MTAKDEFTAEDYAHAQRFGISLNSIASANEEIEDLERMNAAGFHPDHFLDMSWATEILGRQQPALVPAVPIDPALPQAVGAPVYFVPAPDETAEPPWKMQRLEAANSGGMQEAEAKAPPMQEVRFFCN